MFDRNRNLKFIALLSCLALFSTELTAQSTKQSKVGEAKANPKRQKQVGPVVRENRATPIDRIKVVDGFAVELLYSVPGESQGSWVNLGVDPEGMIVASDQFGGLYRFAAPAINETLTEADIQPLPCEIRAVNGMAWINGVMYVGVNDYEKEIPSGLYRLLDTNADGLPDKPELLRELDARGDHGVHAIVPAPDGNSLFLICGNGTKLTDIATTSPVPRVWGEDHLLPRLPDGRGFMRDVMGPGGVIYRVSLDGRTFEAYASGFRNVFDAAFNQHGDLFTYDADMEYDFNTSWYRPTRINHVVSGGEFGWRNGAGKRPPFYPDNLPPVIDIGPGSPTGVTFGYGAKFPAKYQQSVFALDWSWGKLYAIHLTPDGASYQGTKEEFLTGTPLPITDAVIHPKDGAMYFAIGGRVVQSGLYRVRYIGNEPTTPVSTGANLTAGAIARRKLEAYHGRQDKHAIDTAWPYLASDDRFVRWAARTAIEHQPLDDWANRALAESNPSIRLEALLALVRKGGVCPQHRPADAAPADQTLRDATIDSLLELDFKSLSIGDRITWVRTIQIALNRFDGCDDARRQRITAYLEPSFPSPSAALNQLLCETLTYLQSPTVAAKAMQLIQTVPTQEEQIEYARSIRQLRIGWTPTLRQQQFEWFLKAANYRGGASFEKFIEMIRSDAVNSLSLEEQTNLASVLERQPERISALENLASLFAGREEHQWQLDELVDKLGNQPASQPNLANGRRMFSAAGCFACHRFDNQGGMTGPDLTSASRRYSVRDFLDQIVNPSKAINEQFSSVMVLTDDGKVHTGVVVNLSGDNVTLNTDLADPNRRVTIDRKSIEELTASKTSPMPAGLLNRMTLDEIRDLIGFALAGQPTTGVNSIQSR